MTLRKWLSSAATAALIAGSTTLALASPANAVSSSYDITGDELFYCVATASCPAWQDSANWASSTAEWLYPDSTWNGKGDAFRHCLWAGALANRVGYDTAFTLVMIHEDTTTDPMNEVTMDATNDAIGLDLGIRSVSEGGADQWGWILSQCQQRAESGELSGLDGFLGSY
jgi:hypothetical protein